MIKMMNAIRAGNSGFRTNCTILYKQAITPQCLFCSNSRDRDKTNNDDNSHVGVKKTAARKEVDMKKKSKQQRLLNSRYEQGKKAIMKLLQPSKHNSEEEEEEGVDEMKADDVNVMDISNEDIPDEADFSHKTQKVIVASRPARPNSNANLMKLINEAAVELGGDTETAEKELLEAYKSVTDYRFEIKRRERRVFQHRRVSAGTNETDTADPLNCSRISGQIKLNIFTENVNQREQEPQLKMWHKLYERTLLQSITTAPTNYFEQLILWTMHGKLWYFPIDNEQGMELERNTDFTEHVFLEDHLEPWCPKDGPLRHFMELVTVGLSKNPYLSVSQKKEHILWYKDYFESKKKLLMEVGAIDTVH